MLLTRPSLRRMAKVLFLLLLAAGTVLILRRADRNRPQQNAGAIFGTEYHIKYFAPQDLGDSILTELHAVDTSLSLFNDTSTLARLNAGTTEQTDSLFRDVFRLAMAVSAATKGAFDPTVAPLVNAWGFGFKGRGPLPEAAQVDSLRRWVGTGKVRLEGNRLWKADQRVMLDFGAIAKGYAVDRVALLLERRGVENYLVEIGGEVRVRGRNAEGHPWLVGIERPDSLLALQSMLRLTSGALATSGNYRNFYVRDGRRLAHTIDPRTGFPVEHTLRSATVAASSCARADAYATAFMVLGLDSARAVLERNPDLQAFLVYDDGGELREWCSPALQKQMVNE